jgi:hypothetical protein
MARASLAVCEPAPQMAMAGLASRLAQTWRRRALHQVDAVETRLLLGIMFCNRRLNQFREAITDVDVGVDQGVDLAVDAIDG